MSLSILCLGSSPQIHPPRLDISKIDILPSSLVLYALLRRGGGRIELSMQGRMAIPFCKLVFVFPSWLFIYPESLHVFLQRLLDEEAAE